MMSRSTGISRSSGSIIGAKAKPAIAATIQPAIDSDLAHEAAGIGEDRGEDDDGQHDAVDEVKPCMSPRRPYRAIVPKHLSMNVPRSATG